MRLKLKKRQAKERLLDLMNKSQTLEMANVNLEREFQDLNMKYMELTQFIEENKHVRRDFEGKIDEKQKYYLQKINNLKSKNEAKIEKLQKQF
jgi:hypothetical protein